MRKIILGKEILLPILLLALVVMALPRGRRLGSQTTAAIEGKLRSGSQQVRVVGGVVDAMSPKLANAMADLTLVAVVVLVLLFLSFLALMPIALYRLHRSLRALNGEVAGVRREVAEATRALRDLQSHARAHPEDRIWTLPVSPEPSSPSGTAPNIAEN